MTEKMIAGYRQYAADFLKLLADPHMAWVGQQLSSSLKLPVAAFAAEPDIGVMDVVLSGPVFTFPERDGDGNVTSIQGRCDRTPLPKFWGSGNEENKNNYGPRALAYCPGWAERPGPVFVAEGWSDVLAMTHAGLSAVGRPSAKVGADLLIALFEKHLSADRHVILVGEHDQKFHDDGTPKLKKDGTLDWPGKDGAELVAGQLAAALPNPVFVAMVPGGSKDSRAYITGGHWGDTPWPERGAAFVRHAAAVAKDAPPAVQDDRPSAALDLRTEILISANEHEVTATIAAKLAAEPDVYRRDIAIVLHTEGDDGRPTLRRMTKPALRDRMTKIILFKEIKPGKGDDGPREVHAHPPRWAVDSLYERMTDFRGIRPIQRIISHPLFLTDGSVFADPGYHAGTGSLFLHGCEMEVSQ